MGHSCANAQYSDVCSAYCLDGYQTPWRHPVVPKKKTKKKTCLRIGELFSFFFGGGGTGGGGVGILAWKMGVLIWKSLTLNREVAQTWDFDRPDPTWSPSCWREKLIQPLKGSRELTIPKRSPDLPGVYVFFSKSRIIRSEKYSARGLRKATQQGELAWGSQVFIGRKDKSINKGRMFDWDPQGYGCPDVFFGKTSPLKPKEIDLIMVWWYVDRNHL